MKYDTSEYEAPKVGPGKGKGQVIVTEVEPREGKIDPEAVNYQVSFQVVAHEDPGSVGATYKHFFYCENQPGINRWIDFAVACGAISREDVQSGEVDFEHDDLYSQVVCANFTLDKKSTEYLGYDVFRPRFYVNPNSPAGDQYPKSEEFSGKAPVTPDGKEDVDADDDF